MSRVLNRTKTEAHHDPVVRPVSLRPDQLEALRVRARSQHTTIDEQVRRAVDYHLRRRNG